MSGTKKTLVAKAPDGQHVTMRSSGGWDVAGIIKAPSGWFIAAVGCSWESVRKRTITAYNRHQTGTDWKVVPLREALPKAIDEYFADREHTHVYPIVRTLHSRSTGWIDASDVRLAGWAGLSLIRKIQRLGFDAISVGDSSHPADFNVEGLVPRPARRPVKSTRDRGWTV